MVRRTKIIVLTMAVTITHWLGCAGENEQNYKLLNEDRPILQQDHDRRGSDAAWRRLSLVSTTLAEAPATQPAAASAPHASGAMMFDRRDWPRTVITPVDGRTTHFPVYFTDPPLQSSCNCAADGYAGKDIETQAGKAMCGSGPNYTLKEDVRDAAKQPFKFALDLILLPIHICETGPASKTVTTP